MVLKAKSLVLYKIGYDPDGKKKSKAIEVAHGGATRTFAVPIVSGDKGIEFQISEQLPIFSELARVRGYSGQQKFAKFGQYLSGPFKSTWEN